MPLVSIIMPNYNSGTFISEAVNSVICQGFDDWELIICDDGSTDGSFLLASKFAARDSRVRVIKNVYSKGAPGARNSSLDAASGRYIAFLDADDLWHPDKLQSQLEFMRKKSYGLTYSYHEVIDEEGAPICQYLAPSVLSRKKLLLSNFIPCLTVMYDTEIVGKTHQPNIRTRNDYALWLKLICSGPIQNAHCLKRVTASYRRNSYGLSSGNTFDLLKFYRLCVRKFGLVSNFSSYLLLIPYLSLAVLKKKFPRVYNHIVARI